jgi:uncharacterized protein YdhG (YjbR/CyaY superfamily)
LERTLVGLCAGEAPALQARVGMKKIASTKRKTATRPSGKTVDEYLANVPREARTAFEKLRATVKSVVPKDAVEVINYGIPALKMKKVIVWYAAFADHVSLFPTPRVISAFQDELEGYTTSKGTVQFPLDKALPVGLIKKMVKARVLQV